MAEVLTTGSTVDCGHTGTVSTSGASKLKVAGNAVLLEDGVSGKSVSACVTQNVTNTGMKQCTTVTSVTMGKATKLKVGGAPVLLSSLKGATDGTVGGSPQMLLKATAGQTKLKAV